MLISFSDQDLQRMPTRLREQILEYVSRTAEDRATRSDFPSGPTRRFSFSRPPLGARHPRDLVSLTRDQAVEFLRMLAKADQSSWSVLGQFVREKIEDSDKMNSTELAGILGLKNDKTGEWDARLVSPYLKKITHAVRRFTGNTSAGWYTLDPQGMFYLDPNTLDALRYAFEKWEEDHVASP